MKTNKLMLCVLGSVLVFTVAAVSAANPPNLTFKVVTANVPGALATYPSDINNAGVTVGQYLDSSLVYHGYILNGNQLTTVDDPNGTSTDAFAINFNGTMTVVGVYTNSADALVGFMYTNGNFTDILGPAGAVASAAYGINDNSAIVGLYTDSSGVTHGFLLQGTTYTTLDVPGATLTAAEGINNAGDIVLEWVNSSDALEGSVYNPQTQNYKTINVPGSGPLGSFPEGINNEDDITFVWYDSNNLEHGALLLGGKLYKFTGPKPYQDYAGGINDANTFVGSYQRAKGDFWAGFTATFQ